MLSLMMGHAFDAALRHATKLVYARRVVTRTHVASGDHDSKSVPICARGSDDAFQKMNGQNLGQKMRQSRNALQNNPYSARSTICKSAYPGSIPGVASNLPKQKQREAKKLDAQFA